jgi:hypothetical protein
MLKFSYHPSASLPTAVIALITFGTILLQAEDVIVTGCVGNVQGPCPPSCPDSLGTVTHYPIASVAVPAGAARSETLFGITNTASWAITPTLGTSAGVYRIYVSQGTTNECSTNIIVKLVATSGCTLTDTSSIPQTEIYTTAFQRGASLNVWTPVANIYNSTTKPTVLFSYASGGSNRWYMDEVRFENIASGAAAPGKVTAILYGNPLTISGTGPVSRPFALVSSTNAGKSLDQWFPEQTNTAGTGAFSFSVTPGGAKAKFFRVITQ